MKKKLFYAVVAIGMLASCTVDEFVGEDTSLTTSNTNAAIQFVSSTPRITRAEGSAAAGILKHKFNVYGVKLTGSEYSNVFATNAYDATNNTPYWVWYAASTAGTTTSDTKDWDYVGTSGNKYGTSSPDDNRVELTADQTIKYWDYSADQYEFVAYSATVGGTITKYQKDGFTVTATPAQLAGLYVADKLVIDEKNNTPSKPASGSSTVNKFGDVVKLTFRAAAAKVRLGIYETIPGYVVNNVSFRPNGTITGFTAPTATATLSGSFNGSSSATSGTYNVTYAGSDPRIAIFNRDNTATDFRSGYFAFGGLTYAATTEALGNGLGITSTTPTWAGGSADYQSVLPNTDNVGNMILYVDYDLYNSNSGETIRVKGAKAVVPAMYMTWNPNYAYTYLFKISDNTNGTTGEENVSPEGIFPITFDAVTIVAADGQEVGTITTVSTPSITTYQKGSVSNTGITYATASTTEPIYITVTDNTTRDLIDLTTTNIKLYTVDAGTTEADLILTTKTKTSSDLLSILSANETSQGITFTSAKAAKFTPAANTTYAVEFIDASSVKHYKVIVVAPAS